jgi:hypothetical protein
VAIHSRGPVRSAVDPFRGLLAFGAPFEQGEELLLLALVGHEHRRTREHAQACSIPPSLEQSWRRIGCDGAILALGFATMPSIQVKDVPPDVHAALRRRAAAAGQSLQEYLLARLTEEAREESLDEVLARAGGRAGGSVPLSFAAAELREERERR